MNSSPTPTGYELRFRSLFQDGRGVAFPCDAAGHVDLDALGPRALATYLYARTVVGRDFALPGGAAGGALSAQCEVSSGSGERASAVRVAPPTMRSVQRAWP